MLTNCSSSSNDPVISCDTFQINLSIPQHASSPTWDGASTSRPSCSSYIGFQSANVCNSRLPCWCTRHSMTSFLHIWRKIANLRLSVDADNCVRRTSIQCSEPTNVLAITHLLLLDLAYGTVCQPSCESRTSHSDNFGKHSERMRLVTNSCSTEWECFFVCRVPIYLLTYLMSFSSFQE